MDSNTLDILLIEDDPQDAALVQELIHESNLHQDRVSVADCLGRALEMAGAKRYDIALLDIGLPDSEGLDTLVEFKRRTGNLPVVILTGIDDDAFGIKLVQMGAQDYLPKSNINATLLQKTLRFAFERQTLQNIIASQRQTAVVDGEMTSLQAIGLFRTQATTSRLLGQATLDESVPDIFSELTDLYGEIVNKNTESRMYKVNYNVSTAIQSLADRLGYLRASPRDVILIHTTVMGELTKGFSEEKKKFYLAHSRMVLIEVLGSLVSYYRNFALGGFSVAETAIST